ncbi:hypothetical protein GCM10009825_24730 [Arthrobacter humicola]|uniref:Uncharacterized protein n=1 Tax=Arthrobacter humicola TaxID=409291 RepID=A0ABN2Z8F0_9MICC
MTTQRDHRDEHPGCRPVFPWLPAYNRYRLNVNLIAAATEDVAGMPEAAPADWLDFLRGRERPSKWHLQSKFIAHRENWREEELESNQVDDVFREPRRGLGTLGEVRVRRGGQLQEWFRRADCSEPAVVGARGQCQGELAD